MSGNPNPAALSVVNLFPKQSYAGEVNAWSEVATSPQWLDYTRSVYIRQIDHCKFTSGQEHEDLRIKVWAGDKEGIVLVDRHWQAVDGVSLTSLGKSVASSRESSAVISSADAYVRIMIPAAGSRAALDVKAGKALVLYSLAIPVDETLSLAELAALLPIVNTTAKQSLLGSKQCYWSARAIYELVKRKHPASTEVNTDQSHRRGKHFTRHITCEMDQTELKNIFDKWTAKNKEIAGLKTTSQTAEEVERATQEVEQANERTLHERRICLRGEERYAQQLASERRMRLEVQAEVERFRATMAGPEAI